MQNAEGDQGEQVLLHEGDVRINNLRLNAIEFL